jgi:hypothetical protein
MRGNGLLVIGALLNFAHADVVTCQTNKLSAEPGLSGSEVASGIGGVFSSQEKMRCFDQVVRAHYHATIICSYYALAPEVLIESVIMRAASVIPRIAHNCRIDAV